MTSSQSTYNPSESEAFWGAGALLIVAGILVSEVLGSVSQPDAGVAAGSEQTSSAG